MHSIFLHVTIHVAHGRPQNRDAGATFIKDPYLSVGGLNKQIEENRDLLEIPLTRPDLFR